MLQHMRNLENTMHHGTTTMYFQEKNQKQGPKSEADKTLQYTIFSYISAHTYLTCHTCQHMINWKRVHRGFTCRNEGIDRITFIF